MPADSDLVLLEQTLEGDEGAFTTLYRRRQAAVYRFALQMTGNEDAAQDVTQETFLALLTQGARYDAARGTLASFLFGIARHQVHKRLARQRHEEPEEAADLADSGADLLDGLTRQQTADQVRQAILSLPPQYREVVVLCDLQESSYEEAAAALDCPVGTVRSRLSRGRSMLARKLKGTAMLLATCLL